MNPSDYSGLKLSISEPLQTILTIAKMSLSGFNAPYYFFKIDLVAFASQHILGITFWAAFFLYICYRVFSDSKLHKFSKSNISIACFLVFIPNILYGFTERYRLLAQVNPLYLGALFSAPAVIYLFLVGINYSLQMNRYFRVSFVVCLSLLVSLISNINTSNITKYGDEMRSRNSTWQLVDCLVAVVPPNLFLDKVVAPDLDAAIGVPMSYRYWDYYFSTKLKKRVDFLVNPGTEMQYSEIQIVDGNISRDLKYFIFSPSQGKLALKVRVSYDKNTKEIKVIPKSPRSQFRLKGCS